MGELSIEDVVKVYRDFFSKEADYECEVIVYNLDEKNHKIVNTTLSGYL